MGSLPIRKESEEADAHEATRQHVQQEPTKELFATDLHRALSTSASVVLPPEGHLAVSHLDEPVIGNGHSVCVACQVMKNMFWSSERPFGIDHPVMTKEQSQERVECLFIGEMLDASREAEFSVTKSALQAGDELAAKHSAQPFHREEEGVPEANPVFAVERETTDWDHAVDMWMMQKVLAPGMQHTQEADLGAEMFCVSRDFQQRGGTGAEQQVVDDLFVVES
ncbi:MAG: hypothetical protein WB869_00195 [Candidatus Acidiferrales bacterium]